MFKSVFSKYFTIFACILLVAMVALGAVQTVFFNNYWVEDKRVQLTENARMIARHTIDVTVQLDDPHKTYVISSNSIKPIVALLSNGLDADILIVDNAGQVLLASDKAQTALGQVPQTVLDAVQGEYFIVGTMDGFFPEEKYAAATPILNHGGDAIGYVITAMPSGGLGQYTLETINTYLISAVLVLLFASIVIYPMTYRMVKPFREMAAVTRKFANGDFSGRVSVKGKDEVAELAAALNSMAVSLSATENMSRSFVANISHELKTPMTTISGFVDGILDGTIPEEKQAHYLRIVSDEVKRLSRLVKSMLELSRIDNGTVTLKKTSFDLTDAVCGTLLTFEQRIEEKNVEIAGLSDCERVTVNADFDLLGQVVYNLIDNAVKFVPENGQLTIRVARENGRIYCAIRNSGDGLSPEEMPRVFERFYKTDRSRSLDKTGVGLGLYIVKTIVNLHHGEIFVRSVQGEYCEFVFWVPDADGTASGHNGELQETKHRKGRK